MKIHQLKIKDVYARAVSDGSKRFELRKNDRDFKVGDLLKFNVIDSCFQMPFTYEITFVLKDVPEYGLKDGYCILGINPLTSR